MNSMVEEIINDTKSNASKLLKYKWSGDFFNSLKPTDKEIQAPSSVIKDIKTSGMLAYINIGASFLATVLTALSMPNFLGTRSSMITSGGIGALIGAGLVFIIIKWLTNDKKRKATAYFVFFILSALGIIFSVFNIFHALAVLSSGFLGFILGLVTLAMVVVSVASCINMAVGCIDFCLEAGKTE